VSEQQQSVVHAHVEREEKFRFSARFPDLATAAPVLVDEGAPLGDGAGPSPAGLLAAALGSCLAASFVFCLKKMRVDPTTVTADVTAAIVRNERGRLRIGEVDVALSLGAGAGDTAQLERCEQLFEDFCIVTESVRHGIPVQVHVTTHQTAGVPSAG
jgi:uncharacterized OsmC-like protein